MDVIRLLPDSVANQIAAGEVIQRPSSVIKELVENAVDAGATHVDVLVEDAGSTSIQVIDNGKGMSETDARLAFERHATSKIRKAEDLYALHTMGFRGEALPSIVAVSQVTLRTRMADQELGTCLRFEASQVMSQEVVACPQGSNFLVQNLFFNLPARRKFISKPQTELNNIVQEFERMVLVNPGVSFTFSNNGTLVNSYPAGTKLQRIVSVFGKKMGTMLLNVDVDTTICRLTGFVGKPESSRKKGAHQFFFVNGRFMRHLYFQRAVQEAFSGLIPESERIPYFLYFEVDPSSIDVNIHPTKTEIKFENEAAIWQIIVAAIKEALGKYNAVPIIDFDTEGRPSDIPVYNPIGNRETVQAPKIDVDPTYDPFASTPSYSRQNVDIVLPKSSGRASQGLAGSSSFDAAGTDASATSPKASSKPIPDFLLSPDTPGFAEQDAWELPSISPNSDILSQASQGSLYADEALRDMEKSTEHYQYRGQYIFTSVKSGLMVVDQHRAHTRILYNRYRNQMKGQQCPSQGLLFPEIMQMAGSDAVLLTDMIPELQALGFDVTPLGGGSFSLQGVPAGLDGLDPVTLITDMVTSVRESGTPIQDELQHRMALTLSRSAAIPTGQVLSAKEMSALLDDLFAAETPNYTPDGKNVLAIMPSDVIEKMFK